MGTPHCSCDYTTDDNAHRVMKSVVVFVEIVFALSEYSQRNCEKGKALVIPDSTQDSTLRALPRTKFQDDLLHCKEVATADRRVCNTFEACYDGDV